MTMKRIAVFAAIIDDDRVTEAVLENWLDHITENVPAPLAEIWLEGIEFPAPSHTTN